jgi:hypothetical protein
LPAEPAFAATDGAIAILSATLTRTGVLVGTPAYMAPEQFLGDPADARTDQFSYCVALYEAVYGERPFATDDLSALSAAVTEGRVRQPPQGRTVPVWLRMILLRGLQPRPAARFPSMETLLRELADRLAPPSVVRPNQRSSAGAALKLLGALAGLLVAAAVVVTRRVPPPLPATAAVAPIRPSASSAEPIGNPVVEPVQGARVLEPAAPITAGRPRKKAPLAAKGHRSAKTTPRLPHLSGETALKPVDD